MTLLFVVAHQQKFLDKTSNNGNNNSMAQ